MQIDYVVNGPIDRKPLKVIIRYAGTENTISKAEVAGKITDEQVKVYRMCGLSDSDIKKIVQFLRT
jgi:hypothetical protein